MYEQDEINHLHQTTTKFELECYVPEINALVEVFKCSNARHPPVTRLAGTPSVLGGQFDTEIFEESQIVGPIFIIFWDVIAGLFLMNILIAILNKKYSDIQSEAEKNYRERMVERRLSFKRWTGALSQPLPNIKNNKVHPNNSTVA